MNVYHRMCCSSQYWARSVEQHLLPWTLTEAGVELGDNTVEIGPGYGANLRLLINKTARLTAVELDPAMAQRLQRRYGEQAHIIHGDGTQTGLPAEEFSSVVCFTMLHHIPTAALQDRLFAEAFRLLRHGGVFAGTDGVASLVFKLLHFRDTYNPVSPDTLPHRLRSVGFTDIQVDVAGGRQRWRALKP